MLILWDQNKYPGRLAWVTWLLVLANLGVFVTQLALVDNFTFDLALVPAEVVKSLQSGPTDDPSRPAPPKILVKEGDSWVEEAQFRIPRPLTLITSMFLHGSWLHVISNMWFLLIFGRNIERAMGPVLYLVFYLFCGVAGGVADILVDPQSTVPYIGASGAISGVLGAYLIVYPINKIYVWLILVFEWPAFIVLGQWVLVQYISTFEAFADGSIYAGGGVAYWSHLAGVAIGILFVIVTLFWLRLMRRPAKPVGEAATRSWPKKDVAELDPYKTFLSRS
ncbi:MAG: rhomboid family intramembrane serine protease [Gemmataceae bacterium]|nr:rhomboid family intramembrane serine protease [Gemmataceae bacterium]